MAAQEAKQTSMIEKMGNVILFRDPNLVQKFKIRFSFYMALVPLFSAFVLISLILIFAKLNLYYLEGSGIIIDPQVRTAYYDQVIAEVAPLLGYFFALLAMTFAISWVIMNWATYPFVHAEEALKKLLSEKKSFKLDSSWKSESIDFDETVQSYIDSVASKENPKRLSEPPVLYSLNYKFLFKFVAVFLPVSLISSLILHIVVQSVYGKIVSLALNLLHEATIKSHYILAQQDVLQDTQSITLVVSLVAYGFIGRYLSHHIATMIFVFTRAMRENKFPIRLRPTDNYHGLADVLNQLNGER